VQAYQGSFHIVGDDLLVSTVRGQFGQAEVGHFGDVLLVEQDVLGFDVAVNDGRVRQLVQIRPPSRGSHGYGQPLRPVQWVRHLACSGIHSLSEAYKKSIRKASGLLITIHPHVH